MLQVVCGTDSITIRREAFALADTAQAAGAALHRLESDQYAPGLLADAVGASSLFGEAAVYVIDTPSELSDFLSEVLEYAPSLAESSNLFVVIEKALLAPVKKQFMNAGATLSEYKAVAGERFNVFAMADALSRKDKRTLWLLLQGASAAGIAVEEIIGILWWQLKTLRVAALTQSAAEAEMKDYPYNKAKRSVANFAGDELTVLSHSLLNVYHAGHAGEVPLNEALELWVLRM